MTNGSIARMNTVLPATFAAVKSWMTNQPDVEALKRLRDVTQADTVQVPKKRYLPKI